MREDELKKYLSDLALALDVERKLAEPQPALTADSTQEADLRASMAESSVIPRESFFGPPPPVPAKDTRPNTRIPSEEELRGSKSEPARSRFSEWDDEHEEQEAGGESRLSSTREKRFTASSGDIPIALPAPTASRTMQNTMFTVHPLAKVPMSPAAPTPQRPRMPERPTRSFSLRLSASPRKDGLTTSRVVVMDSNGPFTSSSYSTQPHTGFTSASKDSRTQYGRGKYATTELVPQPSDDPQDPLVSVMMRYCQTLTDFTQNWPTWRKELNLYALLMTVAMCNVMKTALVSVNSLLVENHAVSYVAVAALTGVPLMLSACTGLASSVAAKMWGRRPVYLVSMVLLFIGLVSNTRPTASFGSFMAARIFQGFGWGAFDTLVVGSIMDTYFVSLPLGLSVTVSRRSPLTNMLLQEHERSTKIAIYRIVSVATTWGPPLIGGAASQNALGVHLQFEILAIFQIVSIPLLILGAPETQYDRTSYIFEKSTPGSSIGLKSSSRFRRLPAWARGRGFTLNRAIQYIKEVAPPKSYPGAAGGVLDVPLLLQAPRAFIAPTTVLAFLASFLPYSLLWGFSTSLSGLFSRDPFKLYSATVGTLLATPFILSTVAVSIFSLWPEWSKTTNAFRVRSTHLLVLGAGATLSFIGILGFGLYVSPRLQAAEGLRFSALSIILGLLAAGSYILDAPTTPLIHQSARFTSPNLSVNLRNVADMDAGVAVWRALFAGIFVMGIPAAVVTTAAGLKSTGIGVAVVQVFVAGGVGAVWYMWDENVWRLDGLVLRCVGWKDVRDSQSYFELDF